MDAGRHAICHGNYFTHKEIWFPPALVQAEAGVGRLAEADQRFSEARTILGGAETWGGITADVDLSEGVLRAAQGRMQEAVSAFASALRAYRQRGLSWDEAKVYEILGRAFAAEGDTEFAGKVLPRASAMWKTMGAGA